MALFLAGTSGLGKSHWIRQMIQDLNLSAQGFLTYFKSVDHVGAISTTHLKPSEEARNTRGGEPWFNFSKAVPLVIHQKPDLSAFERFAADLASSLTPMNLTVFDELGFFEKHAERFGEVVVQSLHRPLPVVGVIKEKRTDGLLAAVSKQNNVRIFTVNESNLLQIRRLLNRKLSPSLAEHLQLKPGMYAFIGGGGKTSTIMRLAAEYGRLGYKVAVVTSTKMGIPPSEATLIRTADQWTNCFNNQKFAFSSSAYPFYVLGTVISSEGRQKLTTPDFVSWSELKLSFDYVLVEADGSRGLPIKIHADYEPVVPKEADQTIGLFGSMALGMKLKSALHRYEAVSASLNGEIVDVALAFSFLQHYPDVKFWLFNQIDAVQDTRQIQLLAQKMSENAPVLLFSARADFPVYEKWEMGKCIY